MKNTPLAERMRPKTLSNYIGQEHLLGKGQVLATAIEQQNIHSMVFWGPPGVGKTTLARIIANYWEMPFFQLSAINAGVKEVRESIEMAKKARGAILFIDEIHRFNKSQQDRLLGAVENGTISLIGATTENPSFEVISALLSRCQVYTLQHHTAEDLDKVLQRALTEDEYLKEQKIELKETQALLHFSGGDARRLLNLFELAVNQNKGKTVVIDNTIIEKLARNTALYDKNGEQHYDIISAFIKSIRGSDPNAALYWMARMINGGEDPKFIARRILISASEDIGLANPNALLIANAAFDAVERIGYPECEIILSQAVVYLASSPKSNASYKAIKTAKQLAQKTHNLSVPMHLRNAPTKLMKDLDYGKDYLYAHDHSGNFVDQEFMPDALKGQKLYDAGNNRQEKIMAQRLALWWKKKYNYNID